MPQQHNDIPLKVEVDQVLREAIDLGRIRISGKDAAGDELLEMTAKGVVSTAILLINDMIEQSDHEKRDFTRIEKEEITGHLGAMLSALAK